MLRNGGTSTSEQAAVHAAVCWMLNPRPPCSAGQWMPAKPLACSRPCHRLASSTSSGGTIAP
jgi:hypothetical protein